MNHNIHDAFHSDFISVLPQYTIHGSDHQLWEQKLQHSSFPESLSPRSHESPFLPQSPVHAPRGETNDETSPLSEQSAQLSQPNQTNPSEAPPKPKRKRENRYKNAPPSVISRRRAQNRASQRAYRERKDQRIKDLEESLEEARKMNERLRHALEEARRQVMVLQAQQHNNTIWPSDMGWNQNMAFSDVGGFGNEPGNFMS